MPAHPPNPCHSDGLDVLLQLTVFAPTVAQEWPVVEACCSLHLDTLNKPSRAEVGQVTSVGVLLWCGLTAAGEHCPLGTAQAGLHGCSAQSSQVTEPRGKPGWKSHLHRMSEFRHHMKLMFPVFLGFVLPPLKKNAIQRTVWYRIALEILIPFYFLHSIQVKLVNTNLG